MHKLWGWGAAALVLAAASPALANVKTGVDAWARGDYKTAVEEWRGPAVAGDADAQFNLGQAYKLGRGVPLDPGLAESWFRKAALQHHAQAEDNYGLALYQSGRKAEAAPWLEKSAARGEPRGQLVLGTMLFNGDAVPRDVPRAYALMTRASQSGLKAASETLAQMDGYVSPADREKGTALAARYAAEQQSASAATGAPSRVVIAAGEAPRAVDLPPSDVGGSAPPRPYAPYASRPTPPMRDAGSRPATTAKAASPKPAAPKPPVIAKAAPAPKPAPVKASAKPPAATGRYRVQLGAFRDEGNARSLWSRVGGRIGGSPSFIKAGGLTRLVGGGFASEAEAQRACRAAGVSCIVTR